MYSEAFLGCLVTMTVPVSYFGMNNNRDAVFMQKDPYTFYTRGFKSDLASALRAKRSEHDVPV